MTRWPRSMSSCPGTRSAGSKPRTGPTPSGGTRSAGRAGSAARLVAQEALDLGDQAVAAVVEGLALVVARIELGHVVAALLVGLDELADLLLVGARVGRELLG